MNEPENPDFRLSGYDFALPEGLIAQSPAAERSGSRLMVLRRDGDEIEQAMFSDLIRYLPEGCLLVANNSRVVPARVVGKRPSGGKVEFLLLTPLPLLEPEPTGADALARVGRQGEASTDASADCSAEESTGVWQEAEVEGLLRPAKKIPVGEVLRLAPDFALRVLEHGPFGRCRARAYWRGDLQDVLERRGGLPLPPYIRRGGPDAPDSGPAAGDWGTDADRYQTVYARPDKAGSVAAPTAGLHFTPGLREELERSGRQWAEVTLYVGYGTFSPVRGADIREHAMHAEYAELPERTLAAIARAKAEGRPVIAVGTTSARVLEGVCQLRPDLFEGIEGTPEGSARSGAEAGSSGASGPGAGLAFPETAFRILPEEGLHAASGIDDAGKAAFAGWISTFLYPGRPMRVIDGLITNFHLPRSSLLMLVSALAGRERILRAYQRAIAGGFRFFSYGDAMLIV